MKEVLKNSLKGYLSQIFSGLLQQSYSLSFNITYKDKNPEIKVNIIFKGSMDIFNFLIISGVKLSVNLNHREILLNFQLSKNQVSLGEYCIKLNSEDRIFEITNTKYEMTKVSRMLDLPKILSIIPITNLVVKLDLNNGLAQLSIFSNEII